ncbi:PREDICTED: uncharacterized protein LOC109341021, partial [Lupinus angustifolius]|uniref:uncharacterized protein LOC109341021 n=1 Tax=Lupinus angustifolius TaxID=3871 RepID=UPI00092FCD24
MTIFKKRGIQLASACSLCHAAEESSNHLFFECNFAISLWNWLGNFIGSPLDSSSIHNLLMVCHTSWSPQLKVVINASIINTISTIWYCRNQRRFEDTTIRFMQACDWIKRDTTLTGNHSRLAAKPSLFEFGIIRRFQVTPHYNPVPVIAEVRWLPPSSGVDQRGGGIFRDNNGDMLGCFATYLNIQDSLYAELFTAIMAIQIANSKGWRTVWLECDSNLVVEIVKGNVDPPWK